MSNEIIIWGTKIGEPDYMEDLIYSGVDTQKAIAAKNWAANNGFDRIRTSNLDMSIKPNFSKTINI